MGVQYKSASGQETIEMTELQGKKKKQDTVDIIQTCDDHISNMKEDSEPNHKHKQVSFEDGPETFSGCSKTLFLAIILVASGLVILSSSTNLSMETFGQPDFLATYGKESLLPNFQGLELNLLSLETVSSSFGQVGTTLEFFGNETYYTISVVLMD